MVIVMSTFQERVELAIVSRWEFGKSVTVKDDKGRRFVISKKGTVYKAVKAKHHT
jgi:hypothetical protein